MIYPWCWWGTKEMRKRPQEKWPTLQEKHCRCSYDKSVKNVKNNNQEMWKCTYIETSAKTHYNIEAVFQEILTLEQKRLLYLQAEEDKVIMIIIFKLNFGNYFLGQEKEKEMYNLVKLC